MEKRSGGLGNGNQRDDRQGDGSHGGGGGEGVTDRSGARFGPAGGRGRVWAAARAGTATSDAPPPPFRPASGVRVRGSGCVAADRVGGRGRRGESVPGDAGHTRPTPTGAWNRSRGRRRRHRRPEASAPTAVAPWPSVSFCPTSACGPGVCDGGGAPQRSAQRSSGGAGQRAKPRGRGDHHHPPRGRTGRAARSRWCGRDFGHLPRGDGSWGPHAGVWPPRKVGRRAPQKKAKKLLSWREGEELACNAPPGQAWGDRPWARWGTRPHTLHRPFSGVGGYGCAGRRTASGPSLTRSRWPSSRCAHSTCAPLPPAGMGVVRPATARMETAVGHSLAAGPSASPLPNRPFCQQRCPPRSWCGVGGRVRALSRAPRHSATGEQGGGRGGGFPWTRALAQHRLLGEVARAPIVDTAISSFKRRSAPRGSSASPCPPPSPSHPRARPSR